MLLRRNLGLFILKYIASIITLVLLIGIGGVLIFKFNLDFDDTINFIVPFSLIPAAIFTYFVRVVKIEIVATKENFRNFERYMWSQRFRIKKSILELPYITYELKRSDKDFGIQVDVEEVDERIYIYCPHWMVDDLSKSVALLTVK